MRMQPLAALQELVELAGSYGAAYERRRASRPPEADARD